MRKFRTLLSLLLLLESRSLQVKLIKAAGLLLKPTPAFVKSVHAWMPALTGIVCTHALSGATTEVKSSIGDSVTLRVGEELDFEFVTSRYFAQSFSIEGLPEGINSDLGYGEGKLTGSVSEAGNYAIEIIGYRYPGYSGNSTPVFTLSLTVENPDSGPVSSFLAFEELNALGDSWYHSNWFGSFYLSQSGNWIYHQHLGWIYVDATSENDIWLYDEDLHWLYTSKDLFPFFYSNSRRNWLYLISDSSDYRFWDYSSGKKI